MANRISWNQAQEARLREAVDTYNETVRNMKSSGLYDYVPNATSFEREKSRIATRWDLRTRTKQLYRITKVNAGDVVHPENDLGATMPRYLKQEIGYAKRTVNNKRRELRVKVLGDFAKRVIYGTKISDKNLDDIKGNYYTGQDLDDLIDEILDSHINYKAQLYTDILSQLNDNNADPIIRIINRFVNEAPDKLNELFESDYNEIQITYIYTEHGGEEVELRTSRKRKSEKTKLNQSGYIGESYRSRMDKTLDWWREQERKIFGDNQ